MCDDDDDDDDDDAQKKKSTKTNAVRSTATHLIDKENGEALGNIVT